MWFHLLFLSLVAHGLNSPHSMSETAELPRPEVCEKITVKFPDMLGEISATETLSLCHDAEFRIAISSNCKDDKCNLLKAAKNHTKPLSYSPRGTPGAWLCKALGGETEMVFMGPGEPGAKVHVCRKGNDLASADYLLARMPVPKAATSATKPQTPKAKSKSR